jgi:deoxyribodipyrimidine photo-lyase
MASMGKRVYCHPEWDSKLIKTSDDDSDAVEIMMKRHSNKNRQIGGLSEAHKRLDEFKKLKYKNYMSSISKPMESREHCSRLSAYIAWGNLSVREIFQEIERSRDSRDYHFGRDQFLKRLQWQSHFIQKFEREMTIEKNNQNPFFDHIRTEENTDYYERWENGMTGIPLIDACMRCVKETGYLNFRMRAMVVSFLTHHLWQPWQRGAKYLAKCFLDYEPGIHYSQFQMQSCVTGTNTIRIYNPFKQSLEHDPNAIFIKQWVQELRVLPSHLCHDPSKISPMEQLFYNFEVGVDYPFPIVDVETSGRYARDQLWGTKRDPELQIHKKAILQRHGRKLR